MLWISESNVQNFFGQVIRHVAKKLNLSNRKWLSDAELLEQIKSEKPAISGELEKFFEAFKKWHDFHVKAENDNRANSLSNEERKQLERLINNRDTTRNALRKIVNHQA